MGGRGVKGRGEREERMGGRGGEGGRKRGEVWRREEGSRRHSGGGQEKGKAGGDRIKVKRVEFNHLTLCTTTIKYSQCTIH